MTRIRIPPPAALAAEPLLAPLLLLEVATILAAYALRAAHPAVVGDHYPPEDVELTLARVLFNECSHFRATIDDLRRPVLARLRQQRLDPDWPF